MSARLPQVLLALSLLLNCFVLAGFVWRSWIEPPHAQRGGPPPRGMRPIEALAPDLKLDDSQRQELRSVFGHYVHARRERFREIQTFRDSLVITVQKPQL